MCEDVDNGEMKDTTAHHFHPHDSGRGIEPYNG